jgi:hypothetical protein
MYMYIHIIYIYVYICNIYTYIYTYANTHTQTNISRYIFEMYMCIYTSLWQPVKKKETKSSLVSAMTCIGSLECVDGFTGASLVLHCCFTVALLVLYWCFTGALLQTKGRTAPPFICSKVNIYIMQHTQMTRFQRTKKRRGQFPLFLF